MHPDEVGQRSGFHLFHDPSTVDFNGSLADAEFVGDHLVRLARDDEVKHLPFAVGQFLDSIPDFRLLLARGPTRLASRRL